jgi:SAM-dependent methyltransferase
MARDHWHRSALQWQYVGQPLKPAPADVELIMPLLTPGESTRALLLGVTPEIARAANNIGARMISMDRNMEMIQMVWPRTNAQNGAAICGDWTMIPFRSNSVSCVIGDGCFTLMKYPDGYLRVFAEVHRILIPGGQFAMRSFCRPAVAESLAQITEDLRNRRIGNFHVLKWRVAMALQRTIQEGIAVEKIWHALNDMAPEREQLERLMGWNRNEIDTVDVYRGSPAIYTFPTLDEIREILGPRFQETSVHFPTYELGSCCPSVVYTRLSGG